MRPFRASSIVLAALLGLAACASPGAGGTAAPTPCALADTIKDNPQLAHDLQAALKTSRISAASVTARAHHSGCADSVLTAVDFALAVSVTDITAPQQISAAASGVIAALEQVAPKLPGSVTMQVDSTGQAVSLTFTRDQARKALADSGSGVALLAPLGYPGRTAAGASCASLPGRQPLADLTRSAQAALDSPSLIEADVSASVNGDWCGGRFTPRQTEINLSLLIPPSNPISLFGDEAGAALDKLAPALHGPFPGDLPARLVIISSDYLGAYRTILPLDKALSLRQSGLTGKQLFSALGFPAAQPAQQTADDSP